MKTLLPLCLLLFNVISLQAQVITIKGRIVNIQKTNVADATIRCLDKDSVFLTGLTSDSKGVFSMDVPYKESGYKIVVTCIGYKDHLLKLKANKKDIQVGDIILTENAVNLDDVTVTAKQIIRTNEKIMTFPTKEQLRHASDGYTALYNLMIPRLKVDLFNQTVSTRSGNTLLCINGREATVDEVHNLNPKDIQRVDFYETGHPDYPAASTVVDYILISRDYGGTVALSGKQHLNRATGNYEATAQFFKQKSEFAAYVYDGYSDFRSNGGNESLVNFNYTDGTTVTKQQKDLFGNDKGNNIKSYLNYIYKDEKNLFYASARLNRRNADNGSKSMQSFSNQPMAMNMDDRNNSTILNPSGNLSYSRKLKNNQALRIVVLASNNDNNYTRNYLATEGDKTYSTINTYATEKFFNIGSAVMYTKTFRNNGTLTTQVEHSQDISKSHYETNGQPADDYLSTGVSMLLLSYQQNIKKVFLRMTWGNDLTFINNKTQTRFWHSFSPRLNLNYRITQKQTLSFVGKLRSGTPKLQWLSETEQQMDFMQVRKGNPELKLRNALDGMLNYSLEKDWGEIGYFVAANIMFNDFYEQVYQEQDKFVHTYITGKTYYNLNTGIELKLKLIPNILTLTLNGEGNHQTTVAWKRLQVSNLVGVANLLFMYKGFMASADCVSPFKRLRNGVITKDPFNYNFNFGYNYGGLNVRFSMYNPFSSLAKTSEYLSEAYEIYTKEYTRKISDHLFFVTLNYRFSFGKKHRYDNSTMEDTEKSAILKAY